MRATERLADQGAGGEGPASPCSHHRPTVRAAHHCSPPHTGPAVPGPGRPAAAHLAQVRLPPRLPDMVALICQAPGTRGQIRWRRSTGGPTMPRARRRGPARAWPLARLLSSREATPSAGSRPRQVSPCPSTHQAPSPRGIVVAAGPGKAPGARPAGTPARQDNLPRRSRLTSSTPTSHCQRLRIRCPVRPAAGQTSAGRRTTVAIRQVAPRSPSSRALRAAAAGPAARSARPARAGGARRPRSPSRRRP